MTLRAFRVALLAGFIALPRLAAAETFVPTRSAGELTRVTAKLEVRGDLVMKNEGQVVKTPVAVVGETAFEQRLVTWGRTAADRSVAVRHVADAEAHITINGKGLPIRSLPEEKRIIAVRAENHATEMFIPQGHLSRDELDLLTLPADCLVVDRLLPEGDVGTGDSWKIPAKVVTQLCGLDEANSVEVEAKLTKTTVDDAHFEISGKVDGAIDGIGTDIELTGKFAFHRRIGRVRWVALSLKEKRGIGHVGPGVEATSRLEMTINTLEESAALARDRVASMNLDGDAGQMLLWHRSPSGRFNFAHDRRWHSVNDDEKVTVLRLIDRGDFLAQVNIALLAKQQAGKAVSLDAFQADVRKALGDNFGSFVKAGERVNQHNCRVLRIEAIGKVNELEIVWLYYHVTDKQGNVASAAFTLESSLVERFAGADEALIDSLQFTEAEAAPEAETADKSVPNKRG